MSRSAGERARGRSDLGGGARGRLLPEAAPAAAWGLRPRPGGLSRAGWAAAAGRPGTEGNVGAEVEAGDGVVDVCGLGLTRGRNHVANRRVRGRVVGQRGHELAVHAANALVVSIATGGAAERSLSPFFLTTPKSVGRSAFPGGRRQPAPAVRTRPEARGPGCSRQTSARGALETQGLLPQRRRCPLVSPPHGAPSAAGPRPRPRPHHRRSRGRTCAFRRTAAAARTCRYRWRQSEVIQAFCHDGGSSLRDNKEI